MTLHLIYFTQFGKELGENLAKKLESKHMVKLFQGYGETKIKLRDFCELSFREAEGIIFISATGIAVRGIAPFVVDKVSDPAVLVMDDCGKFVISLLSGHLGQANPLTLEISELLQNTPVITTATDNRELFAVDSYAKKEGFTLCHSDKIKDVSSALLRGETISIYSDFPILGLGKQMKEVSEKLDADIIFSYEEQDGMTLIPQDYYIGFGCRKGVDPSKAISFIEDMLKKENISRNRIRKICSIDVKKEEEAVHALRRHFNTELAFFTAETLSKLRGDFSSSSFVLGTVGVDNVCERSVIAGGAEELLIKKVGKEGMTFALGRNKVVVDLREGV